MPLDPHVRRFLDRLASSAPRGMGSLAVEERRAGLERLLELGGAPEAVARIADHTVPGREGAVRARLYVPTEARAEPRPGLVYFHGGGFVAGSLETHDGICRALAQATGFHLLSVEYPLGPEARFPAAVLEACAATRWIAQHSDEFGIDPRRLGVGGDSAGGTLAAVVAQTLAAEEGADLAFQFLLCPILDYTARTASREAFAAGHLLDRETLEHDLAYYLDGVATAADPRISPLKAERLEGLPPACIHTAECDPLRDEGEEYARRLQAAGVSASYRCHSGMIHLFYGLGAVIPYAAEAYRLMGADLRALLD